MNWRVVFLVGAVSFMVLFLSYVQSTRLAIMACDRGNITREYQRDNTRYLVATGKGSNTPEYAKIRKNLTEFKGADCNKIWLPWEQPLGSRPDAP